MFIEKRYQFGKVTISDEDTEEGTIRTLLVDGARESACYVDEGRHFEPRFYYIREFVRLLDETGAGSRVLLIGGGGFTLAKYFVTRFDTGCMDVVERYREMYEIAREYFFLDELYERYDPERRGRLRVFFEDGNDYVERCAASSEKPGYDLVLDDAFVGRVHDGGMLTEHTVSGIRKVLSPDGAYAVNLMSPLRGYGSMQTVMTMTILRNHFREVKIWQVDPTREPTERQNCIIYARGLL